VPVTTTPYTQEMVLIHRVFRREAAQLLRFVSATATGDVARARRLGQWTREYIGGLHHHHATEDSLIWPLLHERVTLHQELVDRMEMQHHALDATLAEVTGRLTAWEESAAEIDRFLLADSIADHQRVLLEHLHDEEELVMPLVEEHLDPAEWEKVGKAGLENLPKEKVFLALGAILEEATDEERAFFMAKVPVAGRLLWKLVGQRQYRRQMAALRGGAQ
jgi:hemerythrin-like domain-containing protein